jgi:hypothetical protein
VTKVPRSYDKTIKELVQFMDEVKAGLWSPAPALGWGTISKTYIKSKSVTASMLDVSELSAVSTKTGSLTLTSGGLSAGSGSSYVGIHPSKGIWLGHSNDTMAPFKVDTTGSLSARNASIKGDVNADYLVANTAGQIGGWSISPGLLYSGNTGLASSGTWRLWSGSSNPSLAPFRVDSIGGLYSTQGQIASWVVSSTALYMDSGSVGMGASSGIRIWAGSSSPSSAPFRVDATGAMVASDAAVSGTVNATSGSFTGSVTTSNLSANGGIIGGWTISTSQLSGSNIVMSSAGAIYSGKTAYGSGTGWRLENIDGTPRLDVGSSSKYLRFDGTNVIVKGRLEFGDNSYIDSNIIQIDSYVGQIIFFSNQYGSHLRFHTFVSPASGGIRGRTRAYNSNNGYYAEAVWEHSFGGNYVWHTSSSGSERADIISGSMLPPGWAYAPGPGVAFFVNSSLYGAFTMYIAAGGYLDFRGAPTAVSAGAGPAFYWIVRFNGTDYKIPVYPA